MKKLFIEKNNRYLRVIVRDNDKMSLCLIEEFGNKPKAGQIYKGVVKNIVPAIKCAFIDIGLERNAYMYLGAQHNKLKNGDEVVVEVLKEEKDEKGAFVTGDFTIGGNFCVIGNIKKGISFSKKINNKEFIRKVKDTIEFQKEFGIVIKSAAEYVDIQTIKREINDLTIAYGEIINKSIYSLGVGLLYNGKNIIQEALRKIDVKEPTEIIVDDEEIYNNIYNYIEKALKNNNMDIKESEVCLNLFNEDESIFEHFNLEKDILKILERKVSLNCGGYLVIDRAEAMYVIDVNSGRNIGGKSIKETAIETNIEAAKEIVRQIILRNLSGIIVVDFIDIKGKETKEKIINILREEFKCDRNKVSIYEFTELNLVQIVRERREKSIMEFLEEDYFKLCVKGRRISFSYISMLLEKEVKRIHNFNSIDNILLEISNIYKDDILKDINTFVQIMGLAQKKVYINFKELDCYYKVQGIIFSSDLDKLEKYKVYG